MSLPVWTYGAGAYGAGPYSPFVTTDSAAPAGSGQITLTPILIPGNPPPTPVTASATLLTSPTASAALAPPSPTANASLTATVSASGVMK